MRLAPAFLTQFSDRVLFPAVKAGLHCGHACLDPLDVLSYLFPAVKAGLHCGRLTLTVSSAAS